jgi:hypothetical protein
VKTRLQHNNQALTADTYSQTNTTNTSKNQQTSTLSRMLIWVLGFDKNLVSFEVHASPVIVYHRHPPQSAVLNV